MTRTLASIALVALLGCGGGWCDKDCPVKMECADGVVTIHPGKDGFEDCAVPCPPPTSTYACTEGCRIDGLDALEGPRGWFDTDPTLLCHENAYYCDNGCPTGEFEFISPQNPCMLVIRLPVGSTDGPPISGFKKTIATTDGNVPWTGATRRQVTVFTNSRMVFAMPARLTSSAASTRRMGAGSHGARKQQASASTLRLPAPRTPSSSSSFSGGSGPASRLTGCS